VVERTAGITVVFRAVNEKLAGSIRAIRLNEGSTPEPIRALQDEGLACNPHGDPEGIAGNVIAEKLGIEEVEGEVLPKQKLES